MTVYAWWSRSPAPGNMGDLLTPVILRALGYRCEWVRQDVAEFFGVGSIVRYATPGSVVWGSGAMWADDRPSPRVTYLAVRGPLTRERVMACGGACPEVYGDPALLLPLLHDDSVRQTVRIGLVPHYRDYEVVARRYKDRPDVRVVNPIRADPLEVVDEIRACRVVYSSSLHGLVVAHAYGIPAAWVRWSDRLAGDDTKFRDYGLSVGLDLEPADDIASAEPVLGVLDPTPLVEALEGVPCS